MRQLTFAAVFLFAACSGSPADSQTSGAGAPVEQGRANAPFQPAFAGQTRAPEQRTNVTIATQEIASGLNHPWGIAVMPDGNLLVTERAGRLRLITPGGQVSDPIAGLPAVFANGQGGLLDVALSPNFASDRLIYWSYAEPRGGDTNSTSVARGRLNANATAVENVERIFQQNPAWRSRGHFGSRLVFDREGRLYITLGDRQGDDTRGFAQDRSNTIGKVVRINADGSVPNDNPFVGQAGVAPEIWSYGHRNVQGADIHPETGARRRRIEPHARWPELWLAGDFLWNRVSRRAGHWRHRRARGHGAAELLLGSSDRARRYGFLSRRALSVAR
jgi:glucose/arabinose dehydrogenase